MRILIADDHRIVAECLRDGLKQRTTFSIVDCVHNYEDTISYVQVMSPHVLLLDLHFTGQEYNGFDVIRTLKQNNSSTKVIVVTSAYEHSVIQRAMQLNVDGYMIKNVCLDELIEYIQMTHEGMLVLHPEIRRILIESGDSKSTRLGNKAVYNYGLNDRQLEIISLIAEGKKNKDISLKLIMEEGTIRNNISKIYKTLRITATCEKEKRIALCDWYMQHYF